MTNGISFLWRCPSGLLAFLFAPALLGFLPACAPDRHAGDSNQPADDDGSPTGGDDDNDNDEENDQDEVFYGVWGSSDSDVFVVGVLPNVLHYDGASWSPMLNWGLPGATLYGVWGTSPSYVIAVGDDGIWNYDGSTWSQMWTQLAGRVEFGSVWGSSPSDIFAVGADNSMSVAVVEHYDGSQWSATYPPGAAAGALFGVWGASPSNVFAAGCNTEEGDFNDCAGAVILSYDGASWSPVLSQGAPPTLSAATGIWGTSASDVFAVGLYGENWGSIWRSNGSSWSLSVSSTLWAPVSVWGTSASNVFAVGRNLYSAVDAILHFDGSAWSPMLGAPAAIGLQGVWGSSPSDVFAVGSRTDEHYGYGLGGLILHYDGLSWLTMWGPGAENGKR